MSARREWFRALMDAAPEVYFRFVFSPHRRLVYVSRAVTILTGHDAAQFLDNPAFCLALVAREDRKIVRQIIRARRALSTTLRLRHKSGAFVRVNVRTVPVFRRRKVIAIECVATTGADQLPLERGAVLSEPVQQRLVGLLYEVHHLLHGALPPPDPGVQRAGETDSSLSSPVLTLGDIVMDTDRMTVTLGGKDVVLTTRELLVLRYFLRKKGRLVSRQQLLADVWGYRYTGDDRTVDVHISRLRRKLPALMHLLHAVKHLGYRLDAPDSSAKSDTPNSSTARRIANI